MEDDRDEEQLRPPATACEVEDDIAGSLPIRLIDVLATISSDKGNIVFKAGNSRGWDFHVIPHTWSKAIRDLSDVVGKQVAAPAPPPPPPNSSCCKKVIIQGPRCRRLQPCFLLPRTKRVLAALRRRRGKADGIIQVDGDRPPDQNLESVPSMDTNVVCAQCQSLPMICRAQRYACNSSFDSSNQTSTIYLVDREAYFGLMQCHSRMMEPSPIGYSKGVEELLGLYGRLRKKHPWRAYDVIVEVGKRNCTVEEDRVLGILGLLGFGSGELSQLRSGKGLPAQIVQLAKICNPEMLLDMCAMDARGCFTPGMSWQPAFHDRDDSWLAHLQIPPSRGKLTVQVERQQVTAAGSLKLRAKVVSAHVLPVNAL
ncbi:hypothetical protein L7F22_056786 [Adiantum nelumboides]|nr:hypothetical protein [Adiantum nelumboides]